MLMSKWQVMQITAETARYLHCLQKPLIAFGSVKGLKITISIREQAKCSLDPAIIPSRTSSLTLSNII